MPLYVISYDIRAKTDHDYKPLYDELESMRAAHLLDSVWLAENEGPAAGVCEALKTGMHEDDCISVIEIFQMSDWATKNVPGPAGWSRICFRCSKPKFVSDLDRYPQ